MKTLISRPFKPEWIFTNLRDKVPPNHFIGGIQQIRRATIESIYT